MTSAELLDAVAKDGSFTKSSAAAVIKSLINCLTQELKAGNEITLAGIGKFTVKATAARKGRNPSTGAAIDIPAKKKVAFVVHRALKEAVQ